MTQVPQIKSILEKIPDEKSSIILGLDVKSPTTVLIVSLLVGGFGVDRFMLGQVRLGVLKLLTMGGLGIWTIVDCCTAMKRTRQHNFEEFVKMTSTISAI